MNIRYSSARMTYSSSVDPLVEYLYTAERVYQASPVDESKVPSPEDYKNYYDKLGEKTKAMSLLRSGLLRELFPNAYFVLDVGPGNYSFANTLHKQDVPCATYNKGDKDTVLYDRYSVVTMFDVLEHMASPFPFITGLWTNAFIVSMPWCHWSPDQEKFWTWKHRKPHEHLCHYNTTALSAIFRYAGYKDIYQSSIEDAIRTNPEQCQPNILTMAFRKGH